MKDYFCPECPWAGKEADAHLTSNDFYFSMNCPNCSFEFEEVDLSSLPEDLYNSEQLPLQGDWEWS